MSPLHTLRDEIAARLASIRSRERLFPSVAASLERALCMVEGAIVLRACCDFQSIISGLQVVDPSLRSRAWFESKAEAEQDAYDELATATRIPLPPRIEGLKP